MKRKIIPYNPHLKELARKLRNNSTHAEIRLWKALKGIFLGQYDFHRQKPIDNYILDFFCVELMLGIEVDGASHELEEVLKKDAVKEQTLNKLGIKLLRFTDRQVFVELPNVLATIELTIGEIVNSNEEI